MRDFSKFLPEGTKSIMKNLYDLKYETLDWKSFRASMVTSFMLNIITADALSFKR